MEHQDSQTIAVSFQVRLEQVRVLTMGCRWCKTLPFIDVGVEVRGCDEHVRCVRCVHCGQVTVDKRVR